MTNSNETIIDKIRVTKIKGFLEELYSSNNSLPYSNLISYHTSVFTYS